MVENALLELPTGLIEASRAMGATPMQIIRKVLLPEALPGLVNAATITLITLVGYSAMGGAVGAGGLGQIGYQYGYIGYNATVMNTVLVLLVVWCISFSSVATASFVQSHINKQHQFSLLRKGYVFYI